MQFVTAAPLFALLLQTAQPSVSYDAALWIAGLLVPGLAQLLKNRLRWKGPAAFYVTLAVSFAVAVGVGFYFGELHTIGDAFRPGATVLGTATAVFKVIKHASEDSNGSPPDAQP
jgi:hypothetical protein